MPAALKVRDLQTTFARLVRDEVTAASGKDGRVGTRERKALGPYARSVVDSFTGSPRVNAVVDRAMGRAMAAVASENQASGPGKAFLSQAELRRIAQGDSDLGDLLGLAGELVRTGTELPPPAPARPALDVVSPLAGTLLGVNSDDSYTLFVDPAQVPNGTPIVLNLEGHEILLKKLQGGVSTFELVAPPGYGIEEAGRTNDADGMSLTLRVVKDPPGALSEGEAKAKAKNALVAFLRDSRIHDADWADYFPTTWQGCIDAGVLGHIDSFFSNVDTEVVRRIHGYTFVGRGPFDLYTEITIDKLTGEASNAYIEID